MARVRPENFLQEDLNTADTESQGTLGCLRRRRLIPPHSRVLQGEGQVGRLQSPAVQMNPATDRTVDSASPMALGITDATQGPNRKICNRVQLRPGAGCAPFWFPAV
jgi:hypothetical protein